MKTVPPNAGEMNRQTERLRAPIKLTDEQRQQAKEWRKVGLDFWEIAEEMKLDENDIKHAVANIRMKRINPPRRSLNVSIAAAELVDRMKWPDEAVWQTVNRLLGIK